MSGHNVALLFAPAEADVWAEHTGLGLAWPACAAFGDEWEQDREEARQAAYVRAWPFLLEKRAQLLKDEEHWRAEEKEENPDGSGKYLLSLLRTHHRPIFPAGHTRLRLPSSFSAFLSPREEAAWGRMFSRHALFPPALLDAKSGAAPSPHAAGPAQPPKRAPSTAPADIVYILQVLSPGLVSVCRATVLNSVRGIEDMRGLPPAAWVSAHREVLVEVLGGESVYERLLGAAGDAQRPWREKEYIYSAQLRVPTSGLV